jgi:putative tributyrin esterase
MGGYGASRLGAKYPDRFCAISAHSAITDIAQMAAFSQQPLSDYLSCGSSEELSVLNWLRSHRHHLPPLRFDCGTEDPLLDGNRSLHQALIKEGIAHQYQEYPGGHTWTYWQEHLVQTLRCIDGN